MLGQTLQRFQSSHFSVAYRSYSPGSFMPWHEHEQPYICIIEHGSLEDASSRGTHVCASNTAFFRPARLAHANRFGDAGAHCWLLQISPDWLKQWYPALDQWRVPTANDPRAMVELRELKRELDLKSVDAALVVESLVQLLLVRYARAAISHTSTRWAKTLAERMREAPLTIRTLEAAAEFVGVHPAQVSEGLRAVTGMTFREYAVCCHVEHATRILLAQPGMSLCEAAIASGFTDQSHMTRSFRKVLGVTPAEWRNRC